jgi:cysteine desulfurase
MEGHYSPDPYYFDYAASEPPYGEALEEFVRISQQYVANPSATHSAGKEAARKLTEKKIEFCNLLGFTDGHLLLCGSATEANNTVIEGHRTLVPQGRVLIAEDVHDSIWYATTKHRDHVDILRLSDLEGAPGNLERLIGPATTLLCMTHVCNETGSVHSLESIAVYCRTAGIRLLVDGSQAIGHIPVNLDQIPFDYYSFSAHKFGGLRGVGGLLIRYRNFGPLLSGGKQEWGLRAGTQNLAGLAAAVQGLKISIAGMTETTQQVQRFKEGLITRLQDQVGELISNTPEECRPGFISLSFPGILGNEMVAALSISGLKIATGSACHADRTEPSRIILATGRSKSETIGTIRISMGRGNTEEAVDVLEKAMLKFLIH